MSSNEAEASVDDGPVGPREFVTMMAELSNKRFPDVPFDLEENLKQLNIQQQQEYEQFQSYNGFSGMQLSTRLRLGKEMLDLVVGDKTFQRVLDLLQSVKKNDFKKAKLIWDPLKYFTYSGLIRGKNGREHVDFDQYFVRTIDMIIQLGGKPTVHELKSALKQK